MAGAWPRRIAPNLSTEVPRAHTQRRRALPAVRRLEGLRFLGPGCSRYRGVRLVFRPNRSKWPAGSHNYPNSAASRLLLLVDVRDPVVAPFVTGNSGDVDW